MVIQSLQSSRTTSCEWTIDLWRRRETWVQVTENSSEARGMRFLWGRLLYHPQRTVLLQELYRGRKLKNKYVTLRFALPACDRLLHWLFSRAERMLHLSHEYY